jgi:hypothetical protein
MSSASSGITQAPRPSSLADVLDLILDKGLVIDAYVRVSVVGIEILTIDARVVIASVDTYLRFAEAVNRLDLRPTEAEGLPGILGSQRDGTGRELPQGQNGQTQNGQAQNGQAQTKGANAEKGAHGRHADGDNEDSLVGRLAERGRWRAE